MAFSDSSFNTEDMEASEAMAVSTATQTRNHVARFRSFLLSRNLYGDFEKLPPQLLNDYLKLFYENIRTESGDFYSPSSLICIRAALHRYLTSVNGNKVMDITHGLEFREANEALKKMFLKHAEFSQLSCKTARFLIISEEDMRLLRRYFNRSTPEILQSEVFFNFIYYFGIRARDHMRLLTRNVIAFGQSPKDGQYVYFIKHNISDFIKSALSPRAFNQLAESRMYASLPKETCPVTALKLYVEQLPTSTKDNTLFPKPLPDGFSSTMLISQYVITNLMPFLSKEAGLSRSYTNHCIFVTGCMNKDNGHSYSALDMAEDDSNESIQQSISKELKRLSETCLQDENEFHVTKKPALSTDADESVSDTLYTCYSPLHKLTIFTSTPSTLATDSSSRKGFQDNEIVGDEELHSGTDVLPTKLNETIKMEPTVKKLIASRDVSIMTSPVPDSNGGKVELSGNFTNCTFHFH